MGQSFHSRGEAGLRAWPHGVPTVRSSFPQTLFGAGRPWRKNPYITVELNRSIEDPIFFRYFRYSVIKNIYRTGIDFYPVCIFWSGLESLIKCYSI